MPIIVETGLCVAGANAYADLATADAYLVPRGLWVATPMLSTEGTDDAPPASGPDAAVIAAKESALIRAADALNLLPWKGEPLDLLSLMAWPRVDVEVQGVTLPADRVPPAVARANMELAALIHNGTFDPMAPVDRGGKVISRSESYTEGSIDVIGGESRSQSVTYAEGAPVETYLPSVYGLLRSLLRRIPGQTGGLCSPVSIGYGTLTDAR